jgi:hypothetical protein
MAEYKDGKVVVALNPDLAIYLYRAFQSMEEGNTFVGKPIPAHYMEWKEIHPTPQEWIRQLKMELQECVQKAFKGRYY